MRVPLTPVEIVMLSKDKPLEFDPGTKYNYDNTGYVFLGAIIEKASGEKYAEYLKKHVFSPVDMNDSGYDDTKSILKNRAAGYGPGGPGGALVNAEYLDMTLPHAAGSLYSTVRDLYRWDRAYYGEKLLSKASKEAMSTPVLNNYAYGLQVGPMAKHKQIGHGGGINGFASYMARFPDDDAVVIVLSNNAAGNAGAVANALAAALFGEEVTLPGQLTAIAIDPKVLDRHTGTYDLGPMKFEVSNESGHLMAAPQGQTKRELHALSETKFFLKEVDATVTFVPGDDGKSKEMHLLQGGQTRVGKRTN
jgi:D-alanyl-D-alanine carboxypeptidase